ncbi:3-dehydroquinate synthase [Thermohalobacter berrensis]|uniref:3-dehydroquinate synthase n=1 Tax=Thermohalobacter berrensis TaxID=99594 RepID=A0A419T9Y7_9FIRM|nr:3-dehydroquinate synthase [Thermohalobacter berrensis]RKD34275.1 3-dehydroquinate synthase [Thermohalobacter berrensis]
MRVLNVDLKDTKYNIYVGAGIFSNIHDILNSLDVSNDVFIITDENVGRLYLDKCLSYLRDYKVNYFMIKPGEKSKNLEVAKEIYKKMLISRCDRQTTVVSLGGGVVGDIAGFVASTYMRGIDFIQVPTTLLAQVDSSVGGKVAVNFDSYKNIIGAFYQPRTVIIDVNFLETLSKRDFFSGLGEVVKYGLIKNYDFFNWLRNNFKKIIQLDKECLVNIIMESLKIKRDVVEIDERDKGIRRILNFGHTIGHGIESLDNFNRYKHGEAVALGIVYESFISKKLDMIDEKYFKEITDMVSKIVELKAFNDKEIKEIMKKMEHDKKKINNKNVFVLPIGKGKVDIFTETDKKVIIKSLKDGVKL